MAKTLRDLVSSKATTPSGREPEDVEIHSMLPGQDDPREHQLEQLLPTGNLNTNPSEMARRFEAGEVTEDQLVMYMDLIDPGWRGRRAHGEPVEDGGGVTRPYNPHFSDDEIPLDLPFDKTVIRRDE